MSARCDFRGWDRFAVVCGGTVWDGNRFAEHHVATHLSRHLPVLFVDPPLSRATAWRRPELASAVASPRLRLLSPSLARLTVVVAPAKDRAGMTALTDALLRRSLRHAVEAIGGRPAAVFSINPHRRVFGACGERVAVYYAADDYATAAGLMGVGRRRLAGAEARVAAEADVVVAASEAIARRWRDAGRRVLLMPNGCDVDAFEGSDECPWPDDVVLDSPLAGYVGHLSERIDMSILEAVARSGQSLLLVGPRQSTFDLSRIEPILALPNVQWVGPKPYEALPSYLNAIDVGIVPYADSPFNRSSFPLKTLEYLAAGRSVVATDLPAMRWLATGHVVRASSPATFAAAVQCAANAPDRTVGAAARRRFAHEHAWRRRVDDLVNALGLTH